MGVDGVPAEEAKRMTDLYYGASTTSGAPQLSKARIFIEGNGKSVCIGEFTPKPPPPPVPLDEAIRSIRYDAGLGSSLTPRQARRLARRKSK